MRAAVRITSEIGKHLHSGTSFRGRLSPSASFSRENILLTKLHVLSPARNSKSEDPPQTRSNPRRSQIASGSISAIRFVSRVIQVGCSVTRVLYPYARYCCSQFSAAADAWIDLMARIKCPHWSWFNFGKKPTPKKEVWPFARARARSHGSNLSEKKSTRVPRHIGIGTMQGAKYKSQK